MTPIFGHTRTCLRARHALITPDGHVASMIPGLESVKAVVHISPVMGARFVQSTLAFEPKGRARFAPDGSEHFVFIQEGSVEAGAGGKTYTLDSGAYLFVPPQTGLEIASGGTAAKLVHFQKPYAVLPNESAPAVHYGRAEKVVGQPFLGNPKALLQVLLPEVTAFDMAVNIFTYQPGAALPFVETHVMEHGLLMLSGNGIYRLEDEWYPVSAGDVIWMASYCPQWFAAVGDEPASYLYYKDVNRSLLP